MNATATKSAAKPAITKTAAELKQEQATLIQSLADLKDVAKMDELMASLKSVKEQIAEIEHERDASIAEVSKAIELHGIKLSELTDAARQVLGAAVARAAAAPAKKRGPAEGSTRKRQEGAVLIKTKGDSGPPAQYKEKMIKAPTVGQNWKQLYEANKDSFEAALATKFTEEGKVYFAKPENRAELEEFMNWVKTKPQTASK